MYLYPARVKENWTTTIGWEFQSTMVHVKDWLWLFLSLQAGDELASLYTRAKEKLTSYDWLGVPIPCFNL